jgi:hypothetical protein
MISIEELLVPVTGDQQLEKFLTSLEALGLKPRAWREGGSLRTILRIVADAYAGFATSMLGFVRAGFLETSSGGWLTMLAYYVYGVSRIEATLATGQVTIVNGGGGVYSGGTAIPIGGLTVANATTKKTYTNVAIVSLNPGDTLTIDVIATEYGSASSAIPGAVTTLITVLPGVTCTNVAAIAGSDAEKDPDLRTRCKNRLSIISGLGPRGAYSYAIRSAVRGDGSPVDINRESVSPSSSTGIVTIYVASPAGAPLLTDLPFVSASIEKYARPDTVTVSLNAAVPVAFSKTLTVWARRVDGVSASDLATLVGNALLAMITVYPVGGIPKPPSTVGYLYATNIEGTAKEAHPSIFAVDGVGADLLMNVGEVATLATTITVRIVDV